MQNSWEINLGHSQSSVYLAHAIIHVALQGWLLLAKDCLQIAVVPGHP